MCIIGLPARQTAKILFPRFRVFAVWILERMEGWFSEENMAEKFWRKYGGK
jgi:hypothetical protein